MQKQWRNDSFLVLGMLHTTLGWCWKILDCTTREDVSGRKIRGQKIIIEVFHIKQEPNAVIW